MRRRPFNESIGPVIGEIVAWWCCAATQAGHQFIDDVALGYRHGGRHAQLENAAKSGEKNQAGIGFDVEQKAAQRTSRRRVRRGGGGGSGIDSSR